MMDVSSSDNQIMRSPAGYIHCYTLILCVLVSALTDDHLVKA